MSLSFDMPRRRFLQAHVEGLQEAGEAELAQGGLELGQWLSLAQCDRHRAGG